MSESYRNPLGNHMAQTLLEEGRPEPVFLLERGSRAAEATIVNHYLP